MVLNEERLDEFLRELGINDFDYKKIAGDASFRSYYRVNIKNFDKNGAQEVMIEYLNSKNQLILMFAPVEHEDVRPFIKINEILLNHHLKAPRIFGVDYENGFLALEDFGDESFNKSMAGNDSNHEEFLYKNSIDVLVKIYEINEFSDIKNYNHQVLFNEVMLFVEWYLKFEKGVALNVDQIKKFKSIFFTLFDKINFQDKRLVLRDYHADNLMLLRGQTADESVGLLDFQDALIGSAAYDLASLLEDARRDVDKGLADKLLEYYLSKNIDVDKKKFITDYKILSLQRNIKILGIFSRLARRDNKDSYLDLIPRVRNHVLNRLTSDDEIFLDAKLFLKDLI